MTGERVCKAAYLAHLMAHQCQGDRADKGDRACFDTAPDGAEEFHVAKVGKFRYIDMDSARNVQKRFQTLSKGG